MNREHHIQQLEACLPTTSTSSVHQQRWMLAASVALLPDDAWSSGRVLPFLEEHHAVVFRIIFDALEEQSELSIVSLRLLALIFTFSCRNNSSVFHSAFCSAGTENGSEEFLSVLIALAKLNDATCTPYLMIIFQSLCNGPCALRFSVALAKEGGSDAMRMILNMFRAADQRSTGTQLLASLLSSKEGSRLCQAFSDDVSNVVLGTSLQREWNLMRQLK